MSHSQQLNFIKGIVESFGQRNISQFNIFEIGSYDVNGSLKSIFQCKTYLGVDLIAGPSVDIVYDGVNLSLPGSDFDMAVSCNCLEHDPNWQNTFLNMINHLNPGGYVVMQCKSRGFKEHGTIRTTPKDSPGTVNIGSNYYRNLNAKDFYKHFDINKLFKNHFFEYYSNSCDLFFVGEKHGQSNEIPKINIDQLKALVINKIRDNDNLKSRWLRILENSVKIDLPIRYLLSVLSDGSFHNYMFYRRKLFSGLKNLIKKNK